MGSVIDSAPELIWEKRTHIIIASNGPSYFAVAKEVNEVENRESGIESGRCLYSVKPMESYNILKLTFIIIDYQL